MSFAPKAGPLIAELLSGFTALLLAYFDLHGFSFQQLHCLEGPDIVVIVLIIWLLGTFIDLLRNLLEHLWDCRWLGNTELNWVFFFHGDEKKLANLDHYFWTFYLVDADIAVAIFLFLLSGRSILSATLGEAHQLSCSMKLLLTGVAALFAIDAWTIRHEIKKLLSHEEPI